MCFELSNRLDHMPNRLNKGKWVYNRFIPLFAAWLVVNLELNFSLYKRACELKTLKAHKHYCILFRSILGEMSRIFHLNWASISLWCHLFSFIFYFMHILFTFFSTGIFKQFLENIFKLWSWKYFMACLRLKLLTF